jgi:hypothetical protein
MTGMTGLMYDENLSFGVDEGEPLPYGRHGPEAKTLFEQKKYAQTTRQAAPKTPAGATARKYYQGTKSIATQTTTVREPTQMWQGITKVDVDLADHTGDAQGLRKSEAVGVINQMGTDQAVDLIYGNRAGGGGKTIDGFATRLNKVDNKTVFSMGGTGSDLTSLYIMALGDRYAHLIYPKGFGTVGVKQEDKGKLMTDDGSGAEYESYVTLFKSQYGIAVEDPRSVVRICNIGSEVDDDPETLILKILQVLRRLPTGANTYALYGNYRVRDIIEKAALERNNVIYSTEDPWGKPLTMLRNLRVRTVTAITEAEEQIPAA